MQRQDRAQRGFTLIELMISLVLFSFAIAGVLAVAVSMAQGYREQRQVVETEGVARGALDLITDAVRGASPAVANNSVTESSATPPSGMPHLKIGRIQDVTSTVSPCPIGSFRFWNGTGLNGSDELEVVYASGGVVTTLRSTWNAATATILTVPPAGAENIAVDDKLLLTDGTDAHLVKVSSVDVANGLIGIAASTCVITYPSAGGYTMGALVIRAVRARFYLGPFDGIPSVLLMDPDGDGPLTPEPLADHVEDLQIAAGMDINADKSLGADEWLFSGVPGTPSTVSLLPPTPLLRAVRFTLVARSSAKLHKGEAVSSRPAAEDHAGAAADAYRRRVLSTVVEIRNLGGSP